MGSPDNAIHTTGRPSRLTLVTGPGGKMPDSSLPPGLLPQRPSLLTEKGLGRNHGRGYTPIPLRLWYLCLVLVYICLLVSLLEYSFHAIPQTANQQRKPPEYGTPLAPDLPPTPQRSRFARRNDTGNSDDVAPEPPISNTTIGLCDTPISERRTLSDNRTSSERCLVPKAGAWGNRFHLDPGDFAQLEPKSFVVHVRYNLVWIHDAGGRVWVPAFPGMDISRRCTLYTVFPYITDNKDDCRALAVVSNIDGEDIYNIYSWLGEMTEKDMQCKELVDKLSQEYMDRPGVVPEPTDGHWGCWDTEATSRTTFNYPSRSVSWPGAAPTIINTMVTSQQTITTTLPPTTSTMTTTTIGPDGKPTVSILTTTIPGRVVTTAIDTVIYTDVSSTAADITVDGTVMTLTNSLGQPTATVTSLFEGTVMTLTNSLGQPTATVTSFSSQTLTDSAGRPTATKAVSHPISDTQPLSTTLQTILNADGLAISTQTRYIIPATTAPPSFTNLSGNFPSTAVEVNPLTWQEYFAGSFAPVLLTTVLSILVQVLNSSLRTMVPFMALSRGKGVTARDSLLLSIEGSILEIDQAIRLAWKFKEPLLLLGSMAQVLGMVVVSLSSEGIGMTLLGGCQDNSFDGCYMSLAVVTGPARAAEGILIGMGVVVLGIIGRLLVLGRRAGDDALRESGEGLSLLRTNGNPSSIVGAAVLLAGEESRVVRELLADMDDGRDSGGDRLISERDMDRWLGGFKFGVNSRGEVVVVEQEHQDRKTMMEGSGATKEKGIRGSLSRHYNDFNSRHQNKVFLGYALKALFIAVLGTLLFIVAYYGSTKLGPDNPLERFMDSQTFGVSFLFTGAGGIIDLFWGGFFSRTELLEPYRSLSQTTDSGSSPSTISRAAASMTRPRSSSIFSGLFRAIASRNLFLSAVALAGVLSKFLPVFLANVPFRLTLTWTTYVVCTWISVAVLGVMMIVMLSSFCVKRPYMPVDPGTIAGRMYYVCDSWVTRDIAGIKDMDAGIKDLKIKYMPREVYSFGKMVGVSGRERIGVDYTMAPKYI